MQMQGEQIATSPHLAIALGKPLAAIYHHHEGDPPQQRQWLGDLRRQGLMTTCHLLDKVVHLRWLRDTIQMLTFRLQERPQLQQNADMIRMKIYHLRGKRRRRRT